MKLTRWLSIPTLAVSLIGASQMLAAETTQPQEKPKEVIAFGTLRTLTTEEARTKSETWLKGVRNDEATQKAFTALWADENRTILDRVTDTLMLGDAEAKRILSEVRDTSKSAPTEVPSLLKDTKGSEFFRSNLALAYAKSLTGRRVYEEALESLKSVKVEQVCDPGSYLFVRAISEYTLMYPKEAVSTIARLIDDAIDAPERYKMVAALMHIDMLTWRDKDLGSIARKMDNIERRLDLDRGGPKTQQMQKEVVMRLDELIKEKENQQKQQGNCNGGSCPNGGDKPGNQDKPSNNTQASSPQNDSVGGNGAGKGEVDPVKFKALVEQWGKLPEKERVKAMLELSERLPPRYRELIDAYYKKLNSSEQK